MDRWRYRVEWGLLDGIVMQYLVGRTGSYDVRVDGYVLKVMGECFITDFGRI